MQAEGRHPPDMGKIARVLTNRIARNQPLQLDTTVHYALGRFTLATSEARHPRPVAHTTPTCTPGLPPGPIGSPGLVAIKAALKPTPGPWMYFVATNPSTGETKFAITEPQFVQLKAEYDAWQSAHPGQ